MKNNTCIKTGYADFDNFIPLVRSFLEKDILELVIDGKRIKGYRSPDAKSIWIRDYSDMLRGVKYFENDMQSVIDHFAETQSERGRIFDYFTTFPEKLPGERENWTKYVRVPVEADVEYRFVKAAFIAWQASGDDEWLQELLPRMEKALEYIISHSWYWDKALGLVKRAYTIDTWDFAYTAGKHDWLQFQIDDNTYWGIFHGDNSGYYEAFRIMQYLYSKFGNNDKSEYWENKSSQLKSNLNKHCWNGSFYTHFLKLSPVEIPGVDESLQLSLSNPMNINRGTTSLDMSVSIIEEYIKRGENTDSFAEWFSIDPPFPDGVFGDEKLKKGAYVNGGIMPLVGGELAKAALENGYEEYGVDILKRYFHLISENKQSFLWYFPDGTPPTIETSTSPEAEATDGWGSSAMLYALIEGLSGIVDKDKMLQKVNLSPRWEAAGIDSAEVGVEYPASGASFSYKYSKADDSINLSVNSPGSVDFHVLLPLNTIAESVIIDNNRIDFKNIKVKSSNYADFSSEGNTKPIVKIKFWVLR